MRKVIATYDGVNVELEVTRGVACEQYDLFNELTGGHVVTVDPRNYDEVVRLARHITGYLDNVRKAAAESKVEIITGRDEVKLVFPSKNVFLTPEQWMALRRAMK